MVADSEFGPSEPGTSERHRPRAISSAVRRAISRERERCAKFAEQKYADEGWHTYYKVAGQSIACAIREQKQPERPI